MSWRNKGELIAVNAVLNREVELLREQLNEKKEEITDLKKQLRFTQEALVAKESPEAYRDRKDAEEAVKLPKESQEEKEERKLQTKIISEYVNELENPTFKDAEDMMQLLTSSSIFMSEPNSLHGNDES